MNIAEKMKIGHFASVIRILTFCLENGIFKTAQFSTINVLETNLQPM